MPLSSPRFTRNPRVVKAAENNPPMRKGESGEGVRILQQALIDLGYSLPITVKRYGSPDGIYGKETANAVRNFQERYILKKDGIAGKNTFAQLDTLLPTDHGLPPLPGSNLPYMVPGLLDPIRQPNGMACWATAYTIMANWKEQRSMSIRERCEQLGTKWVEYFEPSDGSDPAGTSPYDNIEFANTAHLQYEPLMSFTIEAWAQMLRFHGPLWLSFGWEVAGLNGLPTRRGRHIIVITGITGDGSPEGTRMVYIDPGDGQYHSDPFMDFVADYERGFTLDSGMTDDQMAGFSQILHY